MVGLGAVLGVLTGGVPAAYARDLATAALIIAMTFSLTEVRFRGLSPREETRAFGRAFLWNYGALSGLILAIALLFPAGPVRGGWVVMAAGPSAVAVIPLTATFRGNTRTSLVSSALLYVAALGLYPAVTLAFAGQAVDVRQLGVQMLLQIALPLLISRPLAASRTVDRHRRPIVNASFLVLVFALTGANRDVFFTDVGLIGALAVAAFVRTWGIGLAVYAVSGRLGADRAQRVSDTLFGSLKNLALAALLALTLFGPLAAVPAIVSLFLEIAWLVPMQRLFRT
jgi:predicted Na+-dependent transporter